MGCPPSIKIEVKLKEKTQRIALKDLPQVLPKHWNSHEYLQRGYFPGGLPPDFRPNGLEKIFLFYKENCDRLKRKPFKAIHFTFPKLGITLKRRTGQIVHPLSVIGMAILLETWWEQIASFLSRTSDTFIETSMPMEDPEKIRYISPSFTHSKLRKLLDELNICYPFVLKLDIQAYYPSLYTHAIAWSFVGKEETKALLEDSSRKKQLQNLLNKKEICDPERLSELSIKEKLYVIAEWLDRWIRTGQEQESYGIPVGPDHSLLIGEIVGKSLLMELTSTIRNHTKDFFLVRHVDDFYLLTRSMHDQRLLLNLFREILRKYNLLANEEKVHQLDAKEPARDAWMDPISNYGYGFKEKRERIRNAEVVSFLQNLNRGCERFEDDQCSFIYFEIDGWQLESYLSLIRRLQEEHPTKSVVPYGLRRLHFNYRIKPPEFGMPFLMNGSASFYQSLDAQLSRLLVAFPQYIDTISDVYLWYEFKWSRKPRHLSGALEVLLDVILDLTNDHFETLWTLWLAKHYSLMIKSDVLRKVAQKATNELVLVAFLGYLYNAYKTGSLSSEHAAQLVDILIDRIKSGSTDIFWPEEGVKDPIAEKSWFFFYSLRRSPWPLLQDKVFKFFKYSTEQEITSLFVLSEIDLYLWDDFNKDFDLALGLSRKGRGGVSARTYLT